MSDDAVPVPDRLRRPHALVAATRAAAAGLRPAKDGRIEIGPRRGIVYVVATRDLLGRSLRILQAVVAEAECRGWTVEPFDGTGYGERPGVAIKVGDHAYPIEVHEQTETLPFTEDEVAAWRNEWSWLDRSGKQPPPQLKRKRSTGRLSLRLPHGYSGGRANWTEGPRGSLESKLPTVFDALTARATEDDRGAAEAAKRRAEWEREQQRRETNERRARIDRARAERLVAEAEAFDRANQVRRYATALQAKLRSASPEERKRLAEWCAWAESWAERSDPVNATERIVGFDDERDQFHARAWGRASNRRLEGGQLQALSPVAEGSVRRPDPSLAVTVPGSSRWSAYRADSSPDRARFPPRRPSQRHT